MLAYTLFQKSGQFLLDLLYPPRCVNCKSTEAWLCQDCFSHIVFITPPICKRCGMSVSTVHCEQCQNNPLHAIDGIRSAACFTDGPMRSIIHFLKYRNHRAVASALSKILVDAYHNYNLAADVVIPVPLHSSRLKKRGYNQCELLAREMAGHLALPVETRALQRIRKTRSQMELDIIERRQNVRQAFACRQNRLEGQRVLLIDDVCTTGSTLDACATALLEGGAASVWGLTLARAGRNPLQ